MLARTGFTSDEKWQRDAKTMMSKGNSLSSSVPIFIAEYDDVFSLFSPSDGYSARI